GEQRGDGLGDDAADEFGGEPALEQAGVELGGADGPLRWDGRGGRRGGRDRGGGDRGKDLGLGERGGDGLRILLGPLDRRALRVGREQRGERGRVALRGSGRGGGLDERPGGE